MFVGLSIGVGRQRVSGGGIVFDTDYQAVLNYATSLGYTLPSAGQQIKQNQLMLGLKSSGAWAKLDTFAMFATDGSSNFALIDWKRLTTYTAVNSPTFTSNGGFAGNGTSSYIDTNFNPATQGVNYLQNNASRYAWANAINGTQGFDGIDIGGRNRMIRGNVATQSINQVGNVLNTAFDFTATIGMKSIHRTSSTNVELFNAISQSSRTANSGAIDSKSQFILRNGASYALHTISMYAMGASLVSENTSFYNAINTYITSL